MGNLKIKSKYRPKQKNVTKLQNYISNLNNKKLKKLL